MKTPGERGGMSRPEMFSDKVLGFTVMECNPLESAPFEMVPAIHALPDIARHDTLVPELNDRSWHPGRRPSLCWMP
jgi:hypothetical protein